MYTHSPFGFRYGRQSGKSAWLCRYTARSLWAGTLCVHLSRCIIKQSTCAIPAVCVTPVRCRAGALSCLRLISHEAAVPAFYQRAFDWIWSLRKSDLTNISKRAFVSGPTMQLSIAKRAGACDQPSKACRRLQLRNLRGLARRSAFIIKSMQALAIDREPAAGFANLLRGSHVHACPGI